MKLADMGVLDEVFTAINADKSTTCFNTTKLNAWLDTRCDDEWKGNVPVEAHHVQQWLDDGSLEAERVRKLITDANDGINKYLVKPILFVDRQDGEGVILLDGRHRYAAFYAMKVPRIAAIKVPWAVVEPFIVEDAPQIPEALVYSDSELLRIRKITQSEEP